MILGSKTGRYSTSNPGLGILARSEGPDSELVAAVKAREKFLVKSKGYSAYGRFGFDYKFKPQWYSFVWGHGRSFFKPWYVGKAVCREKWSMRIASIEWHAEDRWIDWYPETFYNLYMTETEKWQATQRIRRTSEVDESFKYIDYQFPSMESFVARYVKVTSPWIPLGELYIASGKPVNISGEV
jgi:hypothetical protein